MTTAYVTIVGTLKDNDSAEEKQVTLCGMADVIMMTPGTPPPRPHPQPPLGIWGPNDPRPNPPIAFPPGWIGGVPPGGGGGGGEQEPPFEVKVGWTPETGWIVVYVPTGEHVTPSK